MKDKEGHYCFVYDREGRCNWKSPTSSMDSVTMQIVETVTKAARKEYLEYLREIGVSYIIIEDEENPVRESLEKLKKLFGVDKFVLTGGAVVAS